jgi:hypothetical protein
MMNQGFEDGCFGNSVQLKPFTRDELRRCVDLLRAQFDRAEVLHRQKNKTVLRLRGDGAPSIIAKLWSHPPLAGALRRMVSATPSDQEWRNSLRLAKAGVPVAQLLGRTRLAPGLAGYTDAVFMEDLGDCELATDYLKRLIALGDEARVLQFEDALIKMMERMLAAGIIDVDHGMANVVVQKSGRPVRLDFELARRVVWPALPLFSAMYGEMVGRFIGLHAFAVQPDTARNTRFAARVRTRLRPSPRVLRRASAYASEMMKKQREETGIDTRLQLPWADDAV